MSGRDTRQPDLNCIPYIELKSTTNDTLKFLVDTGSNASYIRPNHAKEGCIKKTHEKNVKTATGEFKVDSFIHFNPFPGLTVKQPFYLFDFHPFFDGLIGYEFLQSCKAIIDTKECKLVIDNHKVQLKKYHKNKMLEPHETNFFQVSFNTKEGEFLVEKDIEIQKDVVINSGLYKIEDNRCFIAISNDSEQAKKFQIPKFPIKINNFIEGDVMNNSGSDNAREVFKAIRTDHLNEKEKAELFKVISNNIETFLESEKPSQCTYPIEHEIITSDEVPVHSKSYRFPHCHKAEINRQVKELLEKGIIRHSVSAYSSPVWIVDKKPDASGKRRFRLVVDYRKLNAKTIADRYPIPNISDVLDRLGRMTYFTTLDLKSGFHQVKVAEKDIHKTAFSVEGGHYEFTRCPFGLRNSPSTFARLMDNILRPHLGVRALVYIDDIIIFGSSLQHHLDNLAMVLKTLNEYNLKVQVDKCEFLCKSVTFLGHVITQQGVKPNPEKIRVIKNFPIPKTAKEIMSFLGILGYYRKFIRDFARITKPLTRQLKKDNKEIKHTEEFVKAFELCKTLLTDSNLLQYPDFTKQFLLTTDASAFAIGGVLSQGPVGQDKPIAYFSRTLQKAEINYSTIEKELLAIVEAVKHFRPYLLGNKFILFTDHKPLTFAFGAKNANARLLRWRLDLEQYDYEIRFRKGSQNVVADGLSRIKIDENCLATEIEDNQTIHSANTSDDHFIESTEKAVNQFAWQIIFQHGENNDLSEEIFNRRIRNIISRESFNETNIKEALDKYLLHGKVNCIYAPQTIINDIQNVFNKFYSRDTALKVVMSHKFLIDLKTSEEQNEIIIRVHNFSHRGIDENLKQLEEKYYFPYMKKKIQAFIALCKKCKVTKYRRDPYDIEIGKTEIAKGPFDIVHTDIFIAQPEMFLTFVDKFSRFATLIPIKSRSINDVKKALTKFFGNYGLPNKIFSDNEPSLKSIEVRGLLQALNVQSEYTPVGRSERNGLVEKFHSTLLEIFRSIEAKYKNLDNQMSKKEIFRIACALYNQSYHSAINMKPIQALYSLRNENQIPIEEILENQSKMYDKIILEYEQKRQKQLEAVNKNKEKAPTLLEGEVVQVKLGKRKSKLKNRYENVVVKENHEKTFLDQKGRKIHKMNLRRKNK